MSTARGSDLDTTDGGLPPTAAETVVDGDRLVPLRGRLFGDFRILQEIGRGGMGVVYEAWQISLARRVALKVLSHGWTDPRRRHRFELEAKAAGALHHTNIVPVFGAGEHEGTLYYVMQFIPGVGLDELLDESRRNAPQRQASTEDLAGSITPGLGPSSRETQPRTEDVTESTEAGPSNESEGAASAQRPPPARAGGLYGGAVEGSERWKWVARLGVQAANGLGYAHSKEVFHRDVKPSNLLLDERGTLWLTDFGLAKWGKDAESSQGGDVVGTLRYMPPEALDGVYGPTGDLYGLGLTLYELLAEKPAFGGRDRSRLLQEVSEASPTPLGQINPRIPRDLAAIIHKAVQRQPDDRYAKASEMEADLQRFLDDRPIQARRVSPAERYWRWARRNPAIAILGAVLTAVLVAAMVVSLEAARRFHAQAEAQKQLADDREAGRREAQRARDEEAEARVLAVSALARLNATRDQLDRTLYDTRASLAAAAWEEGDYGQYLSLLQLLTPDPGAADHRGWEWRFLNGLRSSERLAVGTRTERLSSVAVSPDGAGFATLAFDGTMRLRETADGRERLIIRPPMHTQPRANLGFGIHMLAYSPDGGRLAGAGKDGSIGIYRVEDGSLIRELDTDRKAVLSMAWTPDGSRLAAGFAGHIVRFWDTATGASLSPLPGRHGGPVTAVAVSPDGLVAATASTDGLVRLWSLGLAPALIRTLAGHEGEARAVAFNPDGSRIASAGMDGSLRIWDVTTGELRTLIRANRGGVTALAYPGRGGWIASGGADGMVSVWDPESGRRLQEFLGHTEDVLALAASPHGRLLISASPDGFAKAWDPASPPRPRTFRVPFSATLGGGAECIALSPDGRLIVSGHYDGSLCFWETGTGHLIRRQVAHATRVRRVAFSPDGRRLVSCEGEPSEAQGELRGVAKVWNVDDGRELGQYNGHRDVIDEVMFIDGGDRVVSAGGEGTIRIWGWGGDDPEPETALAGHHGAIRALTIAPDGRTLASGADDGTIRLWDLASGRTPAVIQVGDDILALALSHDGRRLAAAPRDGVIRVWDLDAPESPLRLSGHLGEVNALAFTPDGRLISAGADRTIRVWDIQGGRTLLTLKDHAGPITGLAVSVDGSLLVSCSVDCTVKLWEARAVGR